MIKLNEVCSGFNYVGSTVKKCEIENTIVTLGSEAEYQLALDIKCGDITVQENIKSALLLVTVKCDVSTPNNEELYTSILLETEGMFSVDKDFPDDQFKKMLMINGTSALYGIIRSKFEVISATMYNIGKIVLPMINVLELIKEMDQPAENT